MPDELAAILRHHEELDHATDWLFAGGEDYPPHQNTVGHQWRLTQKRAGVSGIRLHDLRHFYASGLIADGRDVVTVQRALGHAKASTTLAPTRSSGRPARTAPDERPRASPSKCSQKMWARCGRKSPKWALTRASTR